MLCWFFKFQDRWESLQLEILTMNNRRIWMSWGDGLKQLFNWIFTRHEHFLWICFRLKGIKIGQFWIRCIKFHLFLWKLSDVFIAINRFANKFNIYINFVQLCFQFHLPNVLLALFFHAIVLPLSCASLDLWGCRLSSKRGSFSHGGLILCLIFSQGLDFVLGVDPKVCALLFHCYLGCGIICLQ